jgi:uncharacterized protein (UPF0548 family)
VFHLFKPTAAEIDQHLTSVESDTFSYSQVGATREPCPPENYVVDHNRQLLGSGRETFERAKQAVRRWKMFDIAGLKLVNDDTPIEAGQNVALLAEHLGFYSLNFCRVVYVIDEPDRFGLA